MTQLSFGLLLYRTATAALAPSVPLLLRRRGRNGKEDGARTGERLGIASRPRPEGALIWVHGASVGECVAALPLIEKLLENPMRHVLVTSGTVTSARMMAERLPARAFHQFVPVDTPAATRRFLAHWRPDAGLFVDSDIWPNLVLAAKEAGVRLALVNARMSERSFRGWRRVPGVAGALLSAFDLCLAQDEEIAARFRALGARDVRVAGSLKADAPPLPADAGKLALLKDAIGTRPVFLAAQTHTGEDETILPASDLLRRRFAELLTVIVPRHPARAADIAMLCGTRKAALRSEGRLPKADTAVYIADTMGELGLFYRVAPFAFVGGSLIRHGGQNPLEPAKLGCAVAAGPHTFNFTAAYDTIFAAQGTGRVHSAADIAAFAEPLLADAAATRALGGRAAEGAATLGGAVEKTREAIEKLLTDART